jgi:hypothetical protein
MTIMRIISIIIYFIQKLNNIDDSTPKSIIIMTTNLSLPNKRLKIGEDEILVLRNFSYTLTQCFAQESGSLKAYLYEITEANSFGILLPMGYPVNSILNFIEISLIEYELQNTLRKFQHELWSDLFKTSKDPVGRVSEANYFVVLLADKKIDWDSIKRAVGETPLLKLSDFLISSRSDLIIKTIYRNITYKYVSELNPNTSSSDFLEVLYGKAHPRIQEFQQKFRGYDPMDIIFDESFNNPSSSTLRNLLSVGIIQELNENSAIVIAKQINSIKNQYSKEKNKLETMNKQISLLPFDSLQVFYLTYKQWEQSQTLLKALIEIESYSYALDFIENYNYLGDFETIMKCMYRFSDVKSRYDTLETIGESIIKVFCAFRWCYSAVETYEDIEYELIAHAAQKFQLEVYLKTGRMTPNCFRPAFYASKEIVTETYNIEHRISRSSLAEFLKSLVGAYCAGCGVLSAGEFLVKLQLVSLNQWESIKSFFSDDCLAVCSGVSLKHTGENNCNLSDLYKNIDKSSLESILDYQFQDISLKSQAISTLAHKTSADPKVAVLGRSITDLIVCINLWNNMQLESHYFIYFKQEILCSIMITRIIYASGLYKYLASPPEIKKTMEMITQESLWDVNLLKFDNLKPFSINLEDCFYSMVWNVFHDSKSFYTTCFVFGYFFIGIIRYCRDNKKKYRKSLVLKITEIIKDSNDRIEFKVQENSGGFTVKVYSNGTFILEKYAENPKTARVHASFALLKYISYSIS